MESNTDLLPALTAALRAGAAPPPRAGVLLGVSGGPDSMALLDVMARFNEQYGLVWKMGVAHVNHALRGAESDADEALVRAEAERRGLPIFVCTLPRSPRATAIEERARRARFAFFEAVCAATGSSAVALGHHADDQAETILLRLLRGTGLRGAGGMRAVRALRRGSDVRVIRPLIGVRRPRILRYLHARGLACRIDATNDSDAFTRNRIRRHILPQLARALHADGTDVLLDLGERARGIDALLGAVAECLLAGALRSADENRLRLDRTALTMQSPLLCAEVLRRAAQRLGLREGRLNANRLRAAAGLLHDRTADGCIELPGGVLIRRRNDELRIERARTLPPSPLAETQVVLPGLTDLREVGLRLRAELTSTGAIKLARGPRPSPLIEHVDFDRLVPPLLVRARRPGDRFTPLGAPGSRKLSDFMIDRRIERSARGRTPILCDARGVVWVMPHRIDQRVRLTPASQRVLRLHVEPIAPEPAAAASSA